MLNKNEVFHKVRTHLLSQKAKAQTLNQSGEMSCMYRGDNRLKCAVGCLLTEESYHKDLEGLGVQDEPVQRALFASDIDILDKEVNSSMFNMLHDLQVCHDSLQSDSWSNELDRIATRYEIDSTKTGS